MFAVKLLGKQFKDLEETTTTDITKAATNQEIKV
jgi:hypothetical protein